MKTSVAKIILRILGAIAGLFGLPMVVTMACVLYSSIRDGDLGLTLFVAFGGALDAYLIYVGYLLWFRFSPLAVRHICGILAFGLLCGTPRAFESNRDIEAWWQSFVFLAWAGSIFLAYHFGSRRLNRWLFPEGVERVQG